MSDLAALEAAARELFECGDVPAYAPASRPLHPALAALLPRLGDGEWRAGQALALALLTPWPEMCPTVYYESVPVTTAICPHALTEWRAGRRGEADGVADGEEVRADASGT